jgi:SAM-dependent methyltransferase
MLNSFWRTLFARVKHLALPWPNSLSLTSRYIRGRGIEIEALDRPLPLPRGTQVTYVGRLWSPALRQAHPELNSRRLAPVSVIDNGERLERFADGSQDFVVAQRLLDHCQDPIGAFRSIFRVLRDHGIAYLTTRDKRHSADRQRSAAPLAHLLRDHQHSPEWSKRQHIEEHVRLVNEVHDPVEMAEQVDSLLSMGYSICYHVWTPRDLIEFLRYMRRQVPFDIEVFHSRQSEMIAVLRKTLPPAGGAAQAAA